jgi:hypothetical protein
MKNDYGTEKEARALNGVEEPLKKEYPNIRVLVINKNIILCLKVFHTEILGFRTLSIVRIFPK